MTESNKSIENESNKIKRKKFFLYSGALAFGMFAASKIPFNLFKSNQNVIPVKESSIKILIRASILNVNSKHIS